MAEYLTYAKMGMSVVSTLSDMNTQSTEYKLRRQAQDYQNHMQAFTGALSLNAQTENEINVRDAAARAATSIQLQSMQDRAGATASAAASGVTGSSVASAQRGLMRSKLQASEALKKRLAMQRRANTSARRNVHLGMALNKDVSVIPRPSAVSSLLGLGASLIDIYDENQPDGSRTTDALSELY